MWAARSSVWNELKTKFVLSQFLSSDTPTIHQPLLNPAGAHNGGLRWSDIANPLYLFLRAHTHCFGPNSWIKPKYGPEQLICRLVSCWRRKLDAALAALWTTVCQMEAVKSCCRRRLLSALSLWEYRVRIIDHFATRDKKLSLRYGPRTSTPWSQTITGDFLH